MSLLQSKEQIIRFTPMDARRNERDIVAELLRDMYAMNYRVTFRESDLAPITGPLPGTEYTPHELKDILAKIQAAFGVSTSDLAEILRVQRQTIYAWNREENSPNEHSIARLQELDRKADDWNKLSAYPAKPAMKVKLQDEKSLFELLTDDSMDHHKIANAMIDAANRVNDYYKRLNKRANGVLPGSQSRPSSVSEYDILALESVVLPEEE